jgi:hypothetical protein
MKIVIAGPRDFDEYHAIVDAVRLSGFTVSEVVSGCANGADAEGELWARDHNIPAKRFPPDWETHGRAAGPIRNKQMAEYADAAILIWRGEKGTPGTANMLSCMRAVGKPVYLHKV